MKIGDKVQQVLPAPIKGQIVGFVPDAENRVFRSEVAWVDEDGQEHRKVFDDDEIVVLPESPPAE